MAELKMDFTKMAKAFEKTAKERGMFVGWWIPVSERLPEKNMACLVAVGENNLTQTAMYSDLMGTIDHRIFYQGDYGHENFVNITQYVNAWMPLPEPYVPDIYDGNMSENPTGSKPEISSYYGLKSYVRERSE